MGTLTKSHDSDRMTVRGKANMKVYVKTECVDITEMLFRYYNYTITLNVTNKQWMKY